MNLWLRLWWIQWHASKKKPLGILEESVIRLPVILSDLDGYGHMNNSRYLSLMDLGRIDLMLRTGMGNTAKKNRWFPLVGSVHIQYRKSLHLFQIFELHTRILGWDNQWFYLEQHFIRDGREMARAAVRGLFRGVRGSVTPQTVLDTLGIRETSPILSTEINFKPKRKSDGIL